MAVARRRFVSAIAFAALASLVVGIAARVRADDLPPAYLQLSEVDDETWDVSWKVPAVDETTTLAMIPVFPGEAEVVSPARRAWADGTAVLAWRVRVPGGLAGRTVEIPGLAASPLEVIARVVRRDGSARVARVTPWEPRLRVGAEPGFREVVRTFFRLGMEQVLGRLDGLAFLLSLCLLAGDGRSLVAAIAAFSLAHSIVLSLAVLGGLAVPPAPVEALVALSVAFVAAEVVRSARGGAGGRGRRPWVLAFVFGLVHGLGFAAALVGVGLPRASVPAALLSFNLGIEASEIAVVAAVVTLRKLAGWIMRERPPEIDTALRVDVAYAIGAVASAGVFERVAGFWRGG
ncbi:MAG: HupE/UreJ family protein [Alphaproteobacteria bacterium]